MIAQTLRHARSGTLLQAVTGTLAERGGRSVRASRLLRGSGLLPALEFLTTQRNLARNGGKKERRLEIGPGRSRLPGFETLDIAGGRQVDYILDASRPLPFPSGTFREIHSSHALEHLPWFRTEGILREWVRILEPGGTMSIWVPDALKICRTVVQAEEGDLHEPPDGWRRLNPDGSPYLWAAGRLFYGANPAYPSWHRALFTPRFLKLAMERAGLTRVRELGREDVRGDDHGWINLGVEGVKP